MSGTVVVVGGTTFDLFASGLPGLPRIDDVGDEFTARSLVHLPSAPTPSVGGNAGNAIGVGDTSGGSVGVDGGDVANLTDLGVTANGGTAIADASGGDYNLAFVS